VALGHLGQGGVVDVRGAGDRDPGPGDGPQRRRAGPALQQGPLAEDGTGADLGHQLAVDLDAEHAVEQEEDLVARAPLLGVPRR